MKFKTIPLFSLFLFTSAIGISQSLKFTTPEDMLRSFTSALYGNLGIHDNNYFVIERDFGKALDFKNNISSNVISYNINTKKNIGITNLNLLIENGADENKIIFTSIIQWNKKIVGFYTKKGKANKKSFTAYARFFDENLKPIGSNIELGESAHEYDNGAYFGQGGLLINGRNKLAVADEFRYCISPDSSKLLMLCSPADEGNKNIKFKIFDNNLNHIDNVPVLIPLKKKEAEICGFQIDNDGFIYVLTVTGLNLRGKDAAESTLIELHIIDTKNFSEVTTIPISYKNYSTITPCLTIDANGIPTVIGTYLKQDSEECGTFCAKINTKTKQIRSIVFKEATELLTFLDIRKKKSPKYPPAFSKFLILPRWWDLCNWTSKRCFS